MITRTVAADGARVPLMLLVLLMSARLALGQDPDPAQQARGQPRILPRFPAMDLPAAPTFIGVPDLFKNSIAKRDTFCKSGTHACSNLGEAYADQCCDNDHYCFVNSTLDATAQCCTIGNTCNSICPDSDHYLCNQTATITSGSVTSVTTSAACCAVSCTATSQFYCPYSFATTLSLGSTTETTSTATTGGCCPYDFTCGVQGTCYGTSTATTSSASTSGQLTVAAGGCSTGQITCSPIATGCCAATQSCTVVTTGTANQAYCVDVAVTPTGNVTAVSHSSGLSAGAKGGIAVGVIIGAGLLIGAITWAVLHRRREARSRTGGSGMGGGGGEGGSGVAPSSGRRGGLSGRIIGGRPSGVVSPGPSGRGQDMIDVSSDVMSRAVPLRGMTQDYFGPDAVPGPYTDMAAGTSAAGYYDGYAHAASGGVPLEPHGPEDFVAPVEMDSMAASAKETAVVGSRGNYVHGGPAGRHQEDEEEDPMTTEGRYELYGSSPDPAEPEEQQTLAPDPTSPWTPSPGSGVLPVPSPDEAPLRRDGSRRGGGTG